jgi:type IVB pilus formation R64 PilN family outer membrane protein
VGGDSIATGRDAALPKQFEQLVIFRRQWLVTLNDVAEFITSSYGLPVTVTQDAIESAEDVSYDAVDVMRRREQQLQAGGAAQQQQEQEDGPKGPFQLQYEGNLRGFLDKAAARTGNYWRFENGRVVIFNRETRVFALDIQPGSASVSANVSSQAQNGEASGGGEEGGSGASTQVTSGNSTQIEMEIDIFKTASESVAAMLGPKGKLVAAPSLGQLTVTDTPAVLDQVGSYIEQINAIATRQVVLDVRVYAVDTNRSDAMGIKWDLVWSSINGSASAVNGGNAIADASSLGLTVVNPSSPFNGSQLIFDALARQGNISTLTTARLATLSGNAVPVQVGEETGYLASSATTLVPNVGAQTTITPGTVNTGFSLVLVPTIVRGGEVLLQMQLNLSTLREIRKIGGANGDTAVEVPLVGSRQVLQRVKLRSGQTLVLSGFEQERLSADARGLGSPNFALLGGGKSADKGRSTLVVLVTPRVVN